MPAGNLITESQHAARIERLIASGRYQSADEVLADGLRMIERQDIDERSRLDALREAARSGIADIEAGRFHTFSSDDALGAYLAGLANEVIDDAATDGHDG